MLAVIGSVSWCVVMLIVLLQLDRARTRRLIRVGFKSPANEQLEGQSKGRPSFIVHGRRPYRDGHVPLRRESWRR